MEHHAIQKLISCLYLTVESLGHTIIFIIWIPNAHDNLYCDFRQLPQIHPIASSFFYTTLCGEQDDGPMKPTIHGKNWIMLFSL